MAKFTGTAAGIDEASSRELLPAKSARTMRKFKIAVNPNSWRWDDERAKFSPEILKIVLDPGVQNTSVIHRGSQSGVNSTRCERDSANKGHIIINYNDGRLKDTLPSGYMQKWATAGGQQTYSCVWEYPTVFLGNVEWQVDHDLFNDVQDLLAERILPEIDNRLIALHLGRVVKRLSRIKGAEHPLRPLLEDRRDGMMKILEESGDKQAITMMKKYVRRTSRDQRNAEAKTKRSKSE